MRAKEKKIDYGLLIYAICFFFIMFIDWNRISGGAWEQSNLYTGIIVAIVSLSQSNLFKLHKKRFLLCVLGGIGFHIIFHFIFYIMKIYINWKLELIIGNIVALGFASCVLVYQFFLKKSTVSFKYHVRNTQNVLWIFLFIFLALGALSKDEIQSSGYMLICMLVLFFTPTLDEEKDKMIKGMRLGMLTFFWMMQIIAFVFRPYVVGRKRYTGMYDNSNMFALVCLGVMIVSFPEVYLWIKSEKKMNIVILGYLINISAMLSFVIFSIGRIAIFIAGVSVIVFFVLSFITCKGKKEKVLKCLAILGISFCIVCPLLFEGISYIPRILKHPISVYDDYVWVDLENKDNYINAKTFVNSFYERGTEIVNKPVDKNKSERKIADPDYSENKKYELYEPTASGLKVRKAIWKTYLKDLNILGHKSSETMLFYSPYNMVYHAHNIFIQMGYIMGIPAGIFFTIYVWGLFFKNLKQVFKTAGDAKAWVILGFLSLVFAFGFWEVDYMFGQYLWFYLLFFTYISCKNKI